MRLHFAKDSLVVALPKMSVQHIGTIGLILWFRSFQTLFPTALSASGLCGLVQLNDFCFSLPWKTKLTFTRAAAVKHRYYVGI